MSGFFSRALRHTGSSDTDSPLRVEQPESHVTSISNLQTRSVATVRGTLRSVTLRPVDGVSWLEAELEDESGSLVLIWLGRRKIAGIGCGREITVHGRIGDRDGYPVLFNPKYELMV